MRKRARNTYEFDESIISCAICLDEYDSINRAPLVIDRCSHTLCKSCLIQLPQPKACPLCRQVFTTDINKLSKNLTVIELISCVSATVSLNSLPPPPLISSTSSSSSSSLSSSSLSEENLKVYKVVSSQSSKWSKPLSNKDPSNKDLGHVHKGRVLSGWVVTNDHGKFLQLESNDGYVAVRRTGGNDDNLKELPFEKCYSVYTPDETNSPAQGYALRIFPDYNSYLLKAKGTLLFPPKSSFPVSFGRTIGEFGDMFVRVKHPAGPFGWLFETRTGDTCLKCLRTGSKIEMEREAEKMMNLLRRKREEEEEAKLREEARNAKKRLVDSKKRRVSVRKRPAVCEKKKNAE